MEDPAAKCTDMKQPTEREIAVPSEKDVEEPSESKADEPTEKPKQETTKRTMEEEGPSTPSSTLTAPLPMAVLASVLAVLSGALLRYSSFFGGTLVVVFACSLIYAVYRIVTVEPLMVKNIQVQLLGLCVPLLATLAAISAVPEIPIAMRYPAATNALNLLLISAVWLHLALLRRTSERLNQCALLGYSIILIVACVIGTGYIWGRWGWEPPVFGFPYGFPTCLAIIYASVPCIYSTFQLRDKLPISAVETAALITSFLGAGACVATHFYSPAVLPGLILATAVCFGMFVRLDHLEHKMRVPQELWTDDTEFRSNCHAAFKVLPLMVIAGWAGMGVFHEDTRERMATCGEESSDKCRSARVRVLYTAVFACLAVLGHSQIYLAIRIKREKEPPLLKNLNISTESVRCLVAVVAIMIMKIAFACFYLFCFTVPAWAAMAIVGTLCMLMSYLLDRLRVFLLPYNMKLLLTSIGLGFYFLFTGKYLSETYTEADAPPFSSVFMTGIIVCTLFAFHFGLVISEQFKKKRKFEKNPAYFSQSDDISPGRVQLSSIVVLE